MDFLRDIISPVATRIGTAVGAGLAGAGVAHDDVTAIAGGVIALIGLAADILVRRFVRPR